MTRDRFAEIAAAFPERHVLSLGARCDVLGVVGNDGAGRAVERVLAKMGGGCRFVRAENRETTVKTRILARGQQVVRVDREQIAPVSSAASTALAARLRECFPGAHVLVLADYNKGVLSPSLIRLAIDAAADRRVPVIADPKRRNFHCYAGATVFKPNRAELEAALGETARPCDNAWMEAARRRTGADHLLLTLGADGMALAASGEATRLVQARSRPVHDVSGAGDTVAAVVAVSLAAGATLAEAVELAAAAAAAGVAKVGVATVARDEIAALLHAQPASARQAGKTTRRGRAS